MSKPAYTEKRRESIEHAVDVLHGVLYWEEDSRKSEKNICRAFGVSAIISICLLIISLFAFYDISYIFAMISCICAIVFGVCLYSLFKLEDNAPFMIWDGASLFAIVPENPGKDSDVSIGGRYGNGLDRYDMIEIREKLAGPAKSLTTRQIDRILKVYEALEDAKLGNDIEGYAIDLIEDITEIRMSDDEQSAEIEYTDGISREERKIALDAYGWKSFILWIGSMDPVSQAENEL